MIKEIVLDTRELEAPEPIMKVLETLPSLTESSYIKMIHRMEPKMLLSHLIKNDFRYKVIASEDEFFIYIWKLSFDENNIVGL